jgi:hypothetical protein
MPLKCSLPARPGCGRQPSVFDTALAYLRHGWSVVPLRGKCPTVPWRALQQTPACESQLRRWYAKGLLQNLGVVCGAASQHLVVLDIDREAGYAAFRAAFPALVETYTVRTGSGQGYHLYWVVEDLPPTLRVRSPLLGSIELLSQGCQVVAPPSLHPRTGQRYTVERALPLLERSRVDDVQQWLNLLREADSARHSPSFQASRPSVQVSHIDLRLVLSAYFERACYREHGAWLNGPCVFPYRHRHGDAHPSFGFNRHSGYGHCFVCGTFPPDVLCRVLDLPC